MEQTHDFIKFSFQFDIFRLKEDLNKCLSLDWPQHFNKRDYSGNWKIISLRSIGGMETNIHSLPNSSYRNTALLEACDYFQEVISSFKCEKQSVRLMQLEAGSEIKEHADFGLNYESGMFRIHVPIQTNPEVKFWVNGRIVPMAEGECWYANFSLPHRVINEGKTSRIHLVFDCLRNDWSDQLFNNHGYDLEKQHIPMIEVKEEDIDAVIYSLQQLGTEAAKEQIELLLRRKNV